MRWQGRSIHAGIAQGEAMVTSMGISFFGGVDPDTGVVVERGHELEGQSIAGKVLVFPSGKGSTVGSYTLYRLAFSGKAPAAVINLECEPITAVGCIIAAIPCVDHIAIHEIRSGQYVQVDGARAEVQGLSWPGDVRNPLAEPLNGLQKDSFAHYTITKRFPNILRQVIKDNTWKDATLKRLQALIEGIPKEKLELLHDESAPDEQEWNRYLRPFQNCSWLEAPWFLVETYFFRRILSATGFYQDGTGKDLDPYAAQKHQAMGQVFDGLNTFYRLVRDQRFRKDDQAELLSNLLQLSLWGNQADLSMWSVADQNRPQHLQSDKSDAHILVNHSKAASQYLLALVDRSARIDFILDNVGIELAYDLALVDLFIQNNLASTVHLHVKPHPTYVSDAVQKDVLEMVEYLHSATSPQIRSLAERLQTYLDQSRIILDMHFYWTSPLSGWEMPPELRQDLGQTDLIVSKGDANYRRWLGDRSWTFTTPVQSVFNYFPAPMLAFRVLKSNVLLGLPADMPARMDQQDSQWLTNGSWGVIQGVGF